MLISPRKLWNEDKKTAMTPVTFGPRGKPGSSIIGGKYNVKTKRIRGGHPEMQKGSPCFKHAHVDHFIHRYLPIQAGTFEKTGHPHLARATRGAAMLGAKVTPGSWESKHIVGHLLNTSPRWGPGIVPGRHPRHIVMPPDRSKIQVDPKVEHRIKVGAGVAGAAAVGVAGYEAYKHRHEIADHAHLINQKFHHSRFYHTVHHDHGIGRA